MIILPAQLVSTWLRGYVLLSPKVVLFSIYQHLQYFPMIVSALSILAVLSLWGARTGLRPWRGPYADLVALCRRRQFTGAIIGMAIAWAGFAFTYCRSTGLRYQSLALVLAAFLGAGLFAIAINWGICQNRVENGGASCADVVGFQVVGDDGEEGRRQRVTGSTPCGITGAIMWKRY